MHPVLYILMRNDLDSLNPGKAMAQAAHAANKFVKDIKTIKNWQPAEDCFDRDWSIQDDGFGTTIVLGLPINQIECAIEKALDAGLAAGSVIDTTYPIRDGQVTHYLELKTCGYIFIDSDSYDTKTYRELKTLPLHK